MNYRDLTADGIEPLLNAMPNEWKPVILADEDRERIGINGPNVMIAASGVSPQALQGARAMYEHQQVVAGFTVCREESNPRTDKGEGIINTDHYILTKWNQGLRLYGPHRTQGDMEKNAMLAHWPTEVQFLDYIDLIPEDRS